MDTKRGEHRLTRVEYNALRTLFPAARERLTRPGAYEIPSVQIALAIKRAIEREEGGK